MTRATHPSVCVLGTGSAGMHHLRALKAIGVEQPIAIPARRKRAEELRGAGFATAEGLAAAARAGAALCIVATDTARHVGDAMEALAAGMDVLVEKPLSATSDQARPLLAAAGGSGRKVFVACVLRHYASMLLFRQRLPAIGAVHSVDIQCRSYLPDWRPQRPYRESYSARAEDGGVLRDLIHEVDYAGWLFGWPDAVYGRLGNTGRLGIAAEEWADLVWETPAGVVVRVGLDYLSRPDLRRMTACGERGTLEWDGESLSVTLALAGQEAVRTEASGPREATFQDQARDFLAAVRDGRSGLLATLEDGFAAIAVCDAARLSARTGRREPIAKI